MLLKITMMDGSIEIVESTYDVAATSAQLANNGSILRRKHDVITGNASQIAIMKHAVRTIEELETGTGS